VSVFMYETAVTPLVHGKNLLSRRRALRQATNQRPDHHSGQAVIPGGNSPYMLLDSDPVILMSGIARAGETAWISPERSGSSPATPLRSPTNEFVVGDLVKLVVDISRRGDLGRLVAPHARRSRLPLVSVRGGGATSRPKVTLGREMSQTNFTRSPTRTSFVRAQGVRRRASRSSGESGSSPAGAMADMRMTGSESSSIYWGIPPGDDRLP